MSEWDSRKITLDPGMVILALRHRSPSHDEHYPFVEAAETWWQRLRRWARTALTT